jgi:hypothetical protein
LQYSSRGNLLFAGLRKVSFCTGIFWNKINRHQSLLWIGLHFIYPSSTKKFPIKFYIMANFKSNQISRFPPFD